MHRALLILWLPFCLLMSIAAFAASPTPKGTPNTDDFRSAGGASDLLGTKAPPPAPTPTQESDRIAIRCTNDEGYVLSEGESGYDECLAKRREKAQVPTAKKKTY